ncbi:Ubiquitin [Drechslerella dactyloides]|uniref:Ubiquitin n=1 Tax=Drechslerella dactyloides TaxID=74499 RepID=A0AAD6IPE6_DREDA|nr:Ubiquitin [Drechslerella dactyloides]
MPHDPNLVTAAIGALVGCRVITYEEYLRNPSIARDIQPLDVDAFHKSVLIAPAPQSPPPTQSGSSRPNLGFLRRRQNSRPDTPQPQPPPPRQLDAPPPYTGLIGILYALIVYIYAFILTHILGVETRPLPQSSAALVSTRLVTIFVKTLSGRTITLSVTLGDTIDQVKQELAEKADVPPEEQRLVYAGKELKNGTTLRDYGIQQDSTIHLALRILGGAPSVMYLPQGFLDPVWDFDFTRTNDAGYSFSRGGEKYTRPCGWLRYALKVNGKYGPDDDWLGSSNAPGEWPVSYHGTSKDNAQSIAQVGFKLAKGVHFAYGQGIYSSPSHTIAESYAQFFQSGGKRYKVIFQNRVNPANLQKIPDIDYWISPADADIRPYGLCIKEI